MAFLPIVERELRVAARQPRTWWRRVLTTGAALAAFVLVLLIIGLRGNPNLLGRELFSALCIVGFVYVLCAGPLTAADCLSRERREGTLGLLFLTDLSTYDVVLGKVASASLHSVLDLVAALPVMAIPMVMGGVSPGQLLLVGLVLVNILFLSLAVATCASALGRSGRASLAVTVVVLLLLTVGLALVGEGLLLIRMRGHNSCWFYALCPMYALELSAGRPSSVPHWNLWVNMAGMHLLGWICLLAACWRTATSWRDLPVSAVAVRWQERFERWRKGTRRWRVAWRSKLNHNPLAWLDGRNRLPERVVWSVLLLAAFVGAIVYLVLPDKWPDQDWVVLWPIWAQYTLCVWIAIEAPRRLADDKESGALELLLCTPLKPSEIVHGCMGALWRRFGPIFVALIAIDGLLAYVYYTGSEHGGWERFSKGPVLELFMCFMAVFPVQAYALARIGLYQGLVTANSIRATFILICKAGLLPVLVWTAFMVIGAANQQYGWPVRMTRMLAISALGCVHLVICGLFLLHADARLRWDFRRLAAQTTRTPWWKGSLVRSL